MIGKVQPFAGTTAGRDDAGAGEHSGQREQDCGRRWSKTARPPLPVESRKGAAALVILLRRDFSVGKSLGQNVTRSLYPRGLVGTRRGGGMTEEPYDHGGHSEPEK